MREYRSIIIYGLTLFFNAFISFATFSLLTHYLNEVDYGVINLFNSSLVLLSPFIAVGIHYTLGVAYFKVDAASYRKLFTNALALSFALTIVFTGIAFLFREAIMEFVGISLFFVLIIPFICLMTILIELILVYFRNTEEHFLFSGFSIGKNIIEVSLTLLFVIVLTMGWQGRLESLFFTMVIMLLVVVFIIHKRNLVAAAEVDQTEINKVFTAGLPFVPERLGIFVLGSSDRFFINYFDSTADVGFYSAGAQLAIIVNLAIVTLNTSFYPKFFTYLSLPEPDFSGLKKITWLFIGSSAFITLAVVLSIPLFFQWFIGDTFQEGKVYAYNLTLGMFFWGVYNAGLPYLLHRHKNKLIMYITIAGMLVSIGGNYFFVKHFGPIGATYTNLVVYFFMACLMVVFVHKFYRLGNIFGSTSKA